jgi:hypothetical protein
MADLNRGLGATYDQRVADRLADARKSSGIIEKFGESAMDRFKGAASAGGYGLMGLTTDIAGGLGSFAGGPFSEDAAILEAFSDEAYRRAVPLLTEGYTKGSRTAAKDAVPMFSFEDKLLRGQYEQDVADARREASLNMPSDGTGRPMEIQEQIDIFQALNPDAGPITAEQINQLSKGKNLKPFPVQPKKKGLKPFSEGVIEQEQIQADANREASLTMPSGTEVSASSAAPSMETMDEMDAASNLFIEALADTKKAKGEKPVKAKTREEMLEKYKQEFADATGIDISGKPDTSQALMAMGLSMMQNRAGKNFNVGKALDAVGKAGEKAMPALSAARKEAKAARVAAGKYALGQIKADEDVESAIAASELAFQREYLLKEMEMRQKDREANYKAGEVKNPYNSEVMDGLTIRMGRSRDGAKYMDPSNALKKIAGTQRKVNGALETLDKMDVLLDEIGDANTGNAAKIIGDRIKTLFVAGGMTDAKVAFPESGISTEDELRAYQSSIVNEFKRFLTQETGNGISNVDIQNLKELLGDVSVFTNPLTAKKRLSRIRRIFTGKRKSVAALRENIMDPKYYATEQEFLDNQENFDTLLAGTTTYRFLDGEGSPIDVAD